MPGQGQVRSRKQIIQPVIQHPLGPLSRLFCTLGHEQDTPFPGMPMGSEISQGAQPYRHVQVVAAGMHHTCWSPILFNHHIAGIRRTGFFHQGKSIHIRSQQDRGAIPVFQETGNAVATDGMAPGKSNFVQFGSQIR